MRPPLTITKKKEMTNKDIQQRTKWQTDRYEYNELFLSSISSIQMVEDKKVSDRIIEIWPSIVKIVNQWSSLPPPKQSKC